MVEVGWEPIIENVILWKFAAPWTFDEFHRAKDQADVMIDSVTGYVDSVFLVSPGQTIPKNALAEVRKLIAQGHKRHRYIVLVGVRVYLAMLLKILMELIPDLEPRVIIVSTKDEAIQMINKLRPKSA